MSSKFFPMHAVDSGNDAGLAALAPEEIGYGICLSLYFLVKPYARAAMRAMAGQAKPDFANSSFLK